MKTIKYLALLVIQVCFSQEAFHNLGNIQIHNNGQIGFHIDLKNNGVFNENLGLAGFYNTTNALTVSGTKIPRFYNVEIAVDDNLYLDINTEIINNLSFISGHIVTPRNTKNISIDFLNNATYVLEDNERHTDGYASYKGNESFTFPIGNDNKLRPLIIPFHSGEPKFSAAYFNEDANFPSAFNNGFNTNTSEEIIKTISIDEFWDFNGATETQVTLTWDEDSNIKDLVDNLNSLRVVGWNIDEKKWLDLGNFNTTGTITTGTITSITFIPNDYEIITFGSLIGNDDLTVYNMFSPNGDGHNDTFVIAGAHLFKNTLKIYNRWGHLVYKKNNYKNDWNGISNNKFLIDKDKRPPVGTYFYVLEFPEENKNYTGWLYLNY